MPVAGVDQGGDHNRRRRQWRHEQGRRKQNSAIGEAGLRWLLQNQARLGGGGGGKGMK